MSTPSLPADTTNRIPGCARAALSKSTQSEWRRLPIDTFMMRTAGRRRMFDEIRHPRHVVSRVAVGNEFRNRGLLQDQRRGTGPVALRMECAARGVGVEGACIEIPEIEADESAIRVACEPGSDLRQEVVDSGIDERDPHARRRALACCRQSGHRGIQRLDLHRMFQAAVEVLDRASRPVIVVGEPPARNHVTPAVGDGEEHWAAPGRRRLGVARHDPAPHAARLDAVDSNARAVGEHQRVPRAHLAVAYAQWFPGQLHRPTQRHGEHGGRRLVGGTHRGDNGSNAFP